MTDKTDEELIKLADPLSFGGPIHNWFGLGRAQYLTVPRSVLHAMPTEWQKRFTVCLYELDETLDWRPKQGRYWCRLKDDNGRFVNDPLMEYRHPDFGYIESLRRKRSENRRHYLP